METTTNNQNNQKTFNKIVFVEYSYNKPGQHFITVMKTVDGKRKIIGRIFREYDKENKKMNFTAVDWSGTQVFSDAKDLIQIKKQFIEHAHTLAMNIPKNPVHQKNEELIEDRKEDLLEIREQKTTKTQERGVQR